MNFDYLYIKTQKFFFLLVKTKYDFYIQLALVKLNSAGLQEMLNQMTFPQKYFFAT